LVKRPDLHYSLISLFIASITAVIDPKNDDPRSKASGLNYTQQAYSAKLIGLLAARFPEMGLLIIEQRVINGLLNVIANILHPTSQKAAVESLSVFFCPLYHH
jgi:hypothetical protein